MIQLPRKNPKAALRALDAMPKRSLGQNFLSPNVAKRIVQAAKIEPDDIILEIGPGLGVLTKELAQKAKKVIAVEKDDKLCQALEENLKDYKNVEIIHEDILKFPISLPVRQAGNFQFPIKERYNIIANLPYYIATAIIRKFLEAENPPQKMVLTIQKEVAKRICVKPPQMNILAASVQFYAEPKILFYISKELFWPKPKVDGAVIEIKPLIYTDEKRIDADLFFKVVKAGFSQPRKQLANNLAKGLKLNKEEVSAWLLKNSINPTTLAETLTINNWIELVSTIDNHRP
jgi:16S rRNA (adenine1518-N6/adenine1519-N6)-dimethyltransferase